MDFRDRVVVVSGAASGIGRALARRFGRADARLGLLDLEAERLEELARELAQQGVASRAIRCDVTDPAACRAAMEEVCSAFGGIDVLVNNAGLSQRSLFRDTRLDVFRRVMDVNFFGALHCTQAALPALLARRGLVIVMSSIAGFAPLLGRSGYSASKHALHGLFGSLRGELARSGVRVMIVCPGFTDTEIERHALGADGGPATRPRSTTGRLATPDEVTEAILRGAARGRRLLVLSRVGRLSQLLMRISPRLYEWAMARRLAQELEG